MQDSDENQRFLALAEIDQSKARFISKRQELSDYLASDLSESDTRSKFIDCILKDVLGWKEPQITREPHSNNPDGYIDYVLSTVRPAVIIEAKRKNHQFIIPDNRNRHQYRIGGTLSEDKTLKEAFVQTRDYANSKGVTFCCLTNGIQFLFFRSHNDHGVDWENQIVILFRDHDDIERNFLKFYHLLSYEAVASGAIHTHLPVTHSYSEEIRRFKRFEVSDFKLERTRERNKLFPIFRDVISKVFQDLSSDGANLELLERCYVESPRESSYEKGLDGLLRHRPIALGEKVHPLKVSKSDAGLFQKEFESAAHPDKGNPEILLILGGIGVGKSTFINRFRHVLANDQIDHQCLWAYVDFNHYTHDGSPVINWISDQVFASLNRDYPTIEIETFKILKQAYHSEYERLKRGRMQPAFNRSPEEFEERFSEELTKFEDSKAEHMVRVLRTASILNKRRLFLVFDNADPFNSNLQNEVYLIAQKLAKEIGCAAIISLREESYWKNKEFGALSAFHSMSFHVQAPRLVQILSKRFKYARELLESKDDRDFIDSESGLVKREDVIGVLGLLTDTILDSDGKIIKFLEHISPGEIRRALDQLARFFYSGHTNMDALLNAARNGRKLTVGFHEFLTSIILGDREYYSEANSDIVNLFYVDGRSDASNLNRIAILSRITKDRQQNTEFGQGFVPISEVVADCESVGISPDTVRSLLALFNSRRLLETETQIRENIEISGYVRTTAAADYYMSSLVHEAAYIDNILSDTAMANCSHYDKLYQLSAQIAKLTSSDRQTRLKRLECRLERGRIFVNYLVSEYGNSSLKKSQDIIGTSADEIFSTIHGRYVAESHRIMKRASELFG